MSSIPYVSLLLAVVLIYAPRIVVARAQAKQPEGSDKATPRLQQAKLGGLGEVRAPRAAQAVRLDNPGSPCNRFPLAAAFTPVAATPKFARRE